MHIEINASLLVAVLRASLIHASTDDTHEHICSVRVELRANAAEVRVVATDGHRLSVIDVPALDGSAADGAIVLRRDVVEAIVKQIPKSFPIVSLDVALDGRTLTVAAGAGYATYPVSDATFPPYAQVIPATVDTTAPMPVVDASYLGDVGKAMTLLAKATGTNAKRPNGLRIACGGPMDPIVVTPSSSCGASVLVVIMPIRSDEAETAKRETEQAIARARLELPAPSVRFDIAEAAE